MNNTREREQAEDSLPHFPRGFFWGAATAGHQVEGDSHNDWSEWERSEKRIADLQLTGLIARYGLQNFISGKACDHYTLYKGDFDLAKRLGHNATRFSVEWSRIEPEEGKFEPRAIEHYCEVTKYVEGLGLEPFVTLWHWPVPTWLRNKGGWLSSHAVEHFARYCDHVARGLTPHVKFWITLNEPEVYAGNSYLAGIWPPQRRNPFACLRVVRNLIKAHRRAYPLIKAANPCAQVGIAKANIHFEAHRNSVLDSVVREAADWYWNFYFLNRIRGYQDFIGLNHYMRIQIGAFGVSNDKTAVTSDVGWELHPDAMYHVLLGLRRYHKPVYITENGVADAADSNRGWFLLETLRNVRAAVTAGVDVRGYLHWSLMDNFEWEKGFWPRFGLLEVDYTSLERKPRQSAVLYSEICKANGITDDILSSYRHLLDRRAA